jgi:hypothetical protein
MVDMAVKANPVTILNNIMATSISVSDKPLAMNWLVRLVEVDRLFISADFNNKAIDMAIIQGHGITCALGLALIIKKHKLSAWNPDNPLIQIKAIHGLGIISRISC